MIGHIYFYTDADEDAIVYDSDESGLCLTTMAITPPKPNITMITVPGRNGSIDFTDFYGEPIMSRATIKMTFALLPQTDLIPTANELMNLIHGKSLFFRNSVGETGKYYRGRCYVSAWQRKNGIVNFTISAECEPFMYGSIVEGTLNVSGDTLTAYTINSDGDFVSNCSVTLSSPDATALVKIYDQFGNRLETFTTDGDSHNFSVISAKRGGYRNWISVVSTGSPALNYRFYPLYNFAIGV